MTSPAIEQLARLEPISALSSSRLQELAGLCFTETVSKNINPLRMNVMRTAQLLYLLKGDLGLRFTDGSKKILRGGTEVASYPVENGRVQLADAIAITEIEILRIDADLLDIMMTWDQLAGNSTPVSKPKADQISNLLKRRAGEWMLDTSAFGALDLQSGVFSRLPSSNIEQMFKRMTPMPVQAGQTVITQGAEGDYYYLIEQGTAVVSRIVSVSQPPVILAELTDGDAFGEEALVSDNKRNATVTMKTDGVLLKLAKTDFIELLKAPLINSVDMERAAKMVADGAVWLDIRFPTEYTFDHLPGAVNVPLNEIRQRLETLSPETSYIVYCQTGRRSSAATFILVEHGLQAYLLDGGTRASRG